MRYILFILLTLALNAVSVEVSSPEDYEKSPIEELFDIAKEMESMSSKLREDRHDTTVELQGKEIDERLGKLIKFIEDNAKRIQQTTNKPLDKPDRLKQAFGPQNQQPRRLNPDWAKLVDPPNPEITKKHNDWAKLPTIERDQLLQVWAEEIPIRWKKRIEAYFLSVAADAAPPDDRKAEIVRLPKDGDR